MRLPICAPATPHRFKTFHALKHAGWIRRRYDEGEQETEVLRVGGAFARVDVRDGACAIERHLVRHCRRKRPVYDAREQER
ncbi:hypothetical protein PCAR4_610011 [Paraburkholderia caribensis]|nr:hypothetical protein PCAR4_610011 [Paraburkholderia caribensis]